MADPEQAVVMGLVAAVSEAMAPAAAGQGSVGPVFLTRELVEDQAAHSVVVPEQPVAMAPAAAGQGLVGPVFLVKDPVEDQAAFSLVDPERAVVTGLGALEAHRVRVDGICPVVLERDLIRADRTVGQTPQRGSAAHVLRELAQAQWLSKQV
jgi:hypothetical protein